LILTKKIHNNLNPDFDLIDICLDKEEIEWLESRYSDVRYSEQKVALAVMLKYFQATRRYPNENTILPTSLVKNLAEQLGYVNVTLLKFNWHYNNNTIQRFRKLIRKRLNYSNITTIKCLEFIEWFKTQILPSAPTPMQSIGYAENYFADKKIEPPTANRLDRYIQSAQNQFESEWFESLYLSISEEVRLTLDKVIELDDDQDIDARLSITLNQLKQDLRKMDVDSITNFIERLNFLETLKLPAQQMAL